MQTSSIEPLHSFMAQHLERALWGLQPQKLSSGVSNTLGMAAGFPDVACMTGACSSVQWCSSLLQSGELLLLMLVPLGGCIPEGSMG